MFVSHKCTDRLVLCMDSDGFENRESAMSKERIFTGKKLLSNRLGNFEVARNPASRHIEFVVGIVFLDYRESTSEIFNGFSV